jgi:hypothetical protein
MARKKRTQYEIWCDNGQRDEILDLVRGLASMGIPKKHIASELGISEDTLLAWCNKYPELKEAIRRGSAYLYADSANLLIEMMHDDTIDVNLRASIASKFLSYERQKWDAVLQRESGDSNEGGVTLIFKR